MKTQSEIFNSHKTLINETEVLTSGNAIKAMEEFADNCMELYRKPLNELKPLEDLWRLENPREEYTIPDTTQFLIWVREKILNQLRWISVNDELPKKLVMGISVDVIVFDGKETYQDCYDYEFNQWCKNKYKSTVTHWRSMPNKPII